MLKLRSIFFSDARRVDVAFVLFFLVVAAITFVPFRPEPLTNAAVIFGVTIGSIVLLVVWLAPSSRYRPTQPVATYERLDFLALLALLAVATCLFLPLMLIHFDTGTDTSVGLGVTAVWQTQWSVMNRPIVGLGFYLASLLTPGSINGLFVVVVLARCIGAAMLYLTLRTLTPSAGRSIALVAGCVYILNPVELGRFNLWSAWYVVAVATLLASIYLLVRSYLTGSTRLLAAACGLLGFTFLQYEHGYPLAAGAALVLFLLPREEHRKLWLWAWYGVLAIFALRMATYLLFTPGSYQVSLVTNWSSSKPTDLIGYLQLVGSNAWIQVTPVFSWVLDMRSPPASIVMFACAGGAALFACLFAWRDRERKNVRLRVILIAVTLSFAAVVLGVALYFPLPPTDQVPDYGTNPTLRYQFFSAPGQALLWATLIWLVTEILPGRMRRISTSLLLGGFVASAMAAGGGLQVAGGVLNSYYRWETNTKVMRAINNGLPSLQTGDGIFVELPGNENSPLGWNYAGYHLSCILFGIPAFQGEYLGDEKVRVRTFSYPTSETVPPPACIRMHRFRATEGGDVTFIGTERMNQSSETLGECTCVMPKHPLAGKAELPFVGGEQ